ncbi:hypothetical protein LQT97_00715 [Brucella pseudogrignonensis]|uniref:hypothetical protein n=1 Tax=Brucella pseudogrignonensis TaxID=419475 RepID=UPI001E577BA9|nr:hypothetical protein [Brucella pseudogrignonensis]MCD4509746.1 hypothetical protein [Brucella pseudogrignonensis]
MAEIKTKEPIEAGMIFEREHPFTLVTEKHCDPEETYERWRPGAWNTEVDAPYGESVTFYANAVGRVRFSVVSIHTPPGYPTRVFYKRQFFMPDGKAYASGSLKNCIISKFRRDIKEFPINYEIDDLWDGQQ